MKVYNIRASWIDFDSCWENDKFTKIEKFTIHGYGTTSTGVEVHIEAEPTEEEKAEFLAFVKRIEQRLNNDQD